MISIKIPFTKDVMHLSVDFDADFKRNIAFIKNNLAGRTYNPAFKRWEVPYLSKNIQVIKSFASLFSNLEELDELEKYETTAYLTVLDFNTEYQLDFTYDTRIIHIIKSWMKYPRDRGFDGETKVWYISKETWNLVKFDLVEHIDNIGEKIDLPPGEDLDNIRDNIVPKTRWSIPDEEFKELTETIKSEYPFLREYQCRDVALYVINGKILNANQMGLGKTIETGAFISMEKPKKVLIVVPASLKVQWKLELEKFFPEVAEWIYLIKGNIAKREKIWKEAFMNERYIIITNYANLRTNDYLKFELHKKMFDFLVFDEITKCKDRSTQTFKLAEKLRAKRTAGLTGTPLENHLKDIYNIMKIIFPTFFGAWSDFEHQYFRRGGYMNKELFEKPGAAENLKTEIQDFPGWIRWNRRSVLKELPELLINTYRVKLKGKERDKYDLLRDQLLEIYDKRGYRVNTKNILSLILALRRLCSDPEIYDIQFKNSAKKAEFVRIVKDNLNGQKILVFSQFKDCVYLYSKALEDAGIKTMVITGDVKMSERATMISDFEKSEEIKVLMATDAFSYGQNLQMCSILINIDMHFNPAVMKQRIGRIQRIGQKEKVLNVINFLVENSIEEFVYNKIIQKNLLFDTVVSQNEKEFNFTEEFGKYLRKEVTANGK